MLNKLRLAPGTKLTFYNSVAKALQRKVRKFLELNLTFVEVTGEELVRGGGAGLGAFCPPPPPSRIGLRSYRWAEEVTFSSKKAFQNEINLLKNKKIFSSLKKVLTI